MRTAAIVAALISISLPACLGAQSPLLRDDQDLQNAAVKYLRADAALRQSYVLAPDAQTKLQKALALDSPLDVEDEKLVAAAEDALVEFHHGAATKRCDWSMSFEDGPLANTAHRGAIMELVAVSGLRARLRFRDGDRPGAMSDVLAAIAAARHLSLDGSIAPFSLPISWKTQLLPFLPKTCMDSLRRSSMSWQANLRYYRKVLVSLPLSNQRN